MNYLSSLLRLIYPLWLRERLYFRAVAHRCTWPQNTNGVPLEFAPVRLHSLSRTDHAHRQIAWLGFYERELSKRLSVLAKQGGLLIDVGANVGYFSLIWATLNPLNEVYAFEPSPRNLQMLTQNVSSSLNSNRVQIFSFAVGKEGMRRSFDLGPESQSGWGGFSNGVSSTTIEVQVCRLDDIIDRNRTISVLKVDTEGADTWVLIGAEKLLQEQRIRNIFYEVNLERMKQLGIQPDEATKFLKRVGYTVCAFTDTEFYATPA